MSIKVPAIPRAYIWRRIHSLFGLWIVLFLMEHLLTNSQAALLIGESGMGFVRAVNFIKNLPYLPFVEITLIGTPILVHGLLGIKYLFTAKMNSFGNDLSKPRLKEYSRNRAYSWQRISSWILLIGIILHVGYMRFYKYPISVHEGESSFYMVRVSMDRGLYTVSERLGIELYGAEAILDANENLAEKQREFARTKEQIRDLEPNSTTFNPIEEQLLDQEQRLFFQKEWVKALQKRSLKNNQVIAVADNFGAATLLTVRDSFKSPIIGFLYTIFVLAAVFHGFNGLWTFFISWGVVIRMRSQARAVNFCVGLMVLIGLLGLVSIWGTYWINLRN